MGLRGWDKRDPNGTFHSHAKILGLDNDLYYKDCL